MRLLAVAAVTAVLLAGCGKSTAEGEHVGTWRDERGRALLSYAGAEHCDWESMTFLSVEADLDGGSNRGDRQQFVRDPEAEFEGEYLGMYKSDAVLPEAAVDTGFRLDELELWAVPTRDEKGPDAVYVVDDVSVERWPRAKTEIACA